MPPAPRLDLPKGGGRAPAPARKIADPTTATAVEIAASVRAGLTSPRDVAEACCARAAELSYLNAFISFDPDAVRQQADELSDRLQRGQDPGPLAGVAVAPKDIMYVRGHPYTLGTKALPAATADRDAVCVARTREAGAIIFGTAHTHEPATAPPASTRTSAAPATRRRRGIWPEEWRSRAPPQPLPPE